MKGVGPKLLVAIEHLSQTVGRLVAASEARAGRLEQLGTSINDRGERLEQDTGAIERELKQANRTLARILAQLAIAQEEEFVDRRRGERRGARSRGPAVPWDDEQDTVVMPCQEQRAPPKKRGPYSSWRPPEE